MLGEDSDNVHFDVLLLEVFFLQERRKINERLNQSTYVLSAEKPKSEYGESKVDHVIEFATHFPS